MISRLTAPHPAARALVLVAAGLLACTETGPPDPAAPVAVTAARGSPPPKVKEAVPPEATQDTKLRVQVLGSGFDPGSSVRFLLAGEYTGKMVVDSTKFVDGSTLDAYLEVAADADVALYDIEVMTIRGKKGIGTELFTVKVKGAPVDIPVEAAFNDGSGYRLLSDSKGAYDAVILDIGNVFLDARATVEPPRMLCFDFAGQPNAPNVECDHGYFSTADPTVAGGLTVMPVNGSLRTTAQATWIKDRYNWFLRYGEDDCGLGTSVDNRIVVTHPDEATWVLEGTTACLLRMPTRGKPSVEAVGFFDMPFQITLSR